MNGASQKSILIALCVVAPAGIAGAAMSPGSAVQILGFCSLICVSLLSLLQQTRNSIKLDQAAAKVEQVKQTLETTVSTQAEALGAVAAKVEDVHKAAAEVKKVLESKETGK